MKFYTEYRGGSLKVKTIRGAVRLERKFSADVESACVRGMELAIRLVNGSEIAYTLKDGKFVLQKENLRQAVPAMSDERIDNVVDYRVSA